MNPSGPRVAVTGFAASCAMRRWNDNSWLHLSSGGFWTLRHVFDSQAQSWRGQDKDGPHVFQTRWLARDIERELSAAHLWDDGLTVDAERVGVCFAASKNRIAGAQALWHPLKSAPDRAGTMLARQFGARGPLLCPVAACATGAHAIALGAQLIQDGHADVVFAGAIEPEQSPLVMAGYKQLGALSKSGIMRPFDLRRDGFVPNIGGACLVLEREEMARARGATVHGFVSGWSMRADAFAMTSMQPSGDGIARAIEDAVARAGNPTIDYINAHGTATNLNDSIETRGIKSALGARVPVSSTKPLTGHLLGASGAMEAVISLMALSEDFLPPTLNLEVPDADCDLDYLPNQGRDAQLQTVLSLSYGFGGHIGALIFEKN